MVTRIHTARSPTAENLSGPLGAALERHAARRAGHFFAFLFFLKGACELVRRRTGTLVDARSLVGAAATHQIDTGFKEETGQHDAFASTDANVVDLPATGFSQTDATHFCNLGLIGPIAQLRNLAQGDPDASFMVEMCETLAGDTVHLPKQVNIGPDKVIDRLHYTLATEMLGDGRSVFDPWRSHDYAGRARDVMMVYVAGQRARGRLGTAACGDRYVLAYNTLVLDIDDQTRMMIAEECRVLGLDSDAFLG